MPYKDANFRRLYDYIQRKAVDGCSIVRNMPTGNANDRDLILGGFQENVELLPPRKNGNLFYHEIISIKPEEGVSNEKHLQALHDLAHHYLDQRANHHPAFGRVHSEVGNMHIHLMVSANEAHSDRRHRLPKQRFAAIQKDCERWFNVTFPELRQDPLYSRTEPKRETPSRQETERAKRTKIPSKKQELAEILLELFKKIENKDEFMMALELSKVEFYRRGKTRGVVFEGKKYRLKTLGVLDEFEAAKLRWETLENRRRDLSVFYRKLDEQPQKEFELPPIINPPVGWK